MGWSRCWFASLVAVSLLLTSCIHDRREHKPEGDAGVSQEDAGVSFIPGEFIDGWGSAPGYGLSWVSRIETVGPTMSYDGNWIWATSFAPNGDLVACGSLSRTLTLFGSDTNSAIMIDPSDQEQLFLARFDSNGTPIWVSTIRTQAGWFEITDLVAMADGSVLVSGRLAFHEQDRPVFGVGEPGETTIEACDKTCPFIAKYNSDGTFDWVSNTIGDGYGGGFSSVAVATNGDICVSGWFRSPLVFDNGTPDGATLECQMGNNGFLARFDGNGEFLWARGTKETVEEACVSCGGVTAMPDGSCAILTTYVGNTEVDTGFSEPLELIAGGFWSLMVAKYLDNGDLKWVKDLGIVGSDTNVASCPVQMRRGMAALGDDLVVGSEFTGTLLAGNEKAPVYVSAGETDRDIGFFLARLSGSDGSRSWTSTATGTTNLDLQFDLLWSVGTAPEDRIVVVGGFTGSKLFGAGEPGETNLVSWNGAMDAFVAVYDAEGSFHWASRVATQIFYHEDSYRPNLGAWITSVDSDPGGSLVLGGMFVGEAIFGTGQDDAVVFSSDRYQDAFLLRLDPDDQESEQ